MGFLGVPLSTLASYHLLLHIDLVFSTVYQNCLVALNKIISVMNEVMVVYKKSYGARRAGRTSSRRIKHNQNQNNHHTPGIII